MEPSDEKAEASREAASLSVPPDYQAAYQKIVALTDAFCDQRLNEDYKALCQKMAEAICQDGSPIKRGKPESWACGIVYTLGRLNFLSDPSQEPHLRSEDIAKGFGVSEATMQNKNREIREGLNLTGLDMDFMLPSRRESHPFNQLAGIMNDMGIGASPLFNEILGSLQQAMHDPSDGPRVFKTAPKPKPGLILQFKVTLLDTDPPIWRRIQVPDCTLFTFAEILLEAMGWQREHLHEFDIAGEAYGPEDPDDPDVHDASDFLLSVFLPEGGKELKFHFTYDFGDDWQHEIVLEQVLQKEKGVRYPRCIEGERACPPEDIGGPPGFAEFLEAMIEPTHAAHEEVMEWRGRFDPEALDLQETTVRMGGAYRCTR